MAITPPITSVGTGKPVKAGIPLRVNRNPSRQAVQLSSAETFREFSALKSQRSKPSNDEIGQRASLIPQRIKSGSTVDLRI